MNNLRFLSMLSLLALGAGCGDVPTDDGESFDEQSELGELKQPIISQGQDGNFYSGVVARSNATNDMCSTVMLATDTCVLPRQRSMFLCVDTGSFTATERNAVHGALSAQIATILHRLEVAGSRFFGRTQ